MATTHLVVPYQCNLCLYFNCIIFTAILGFTFAVIIIVFYKTLIMHNLFGKLRVMLRVTGEHMATSLNNVMFNAHLTGGGVQVFLEGALKPGGFRF